MVRCPNCGRRTSGDYCQWCNYPILRGSRRRRQKTGETREQAKQEAIEARRAKAAEKKAKQEAEKAAREQAKQEAIEARRAKAAEKKAKQEAEKAAREQAKQEAIEARRAKAAEKKAKQEAIEARKAREAEGKVLSFVGKFSLVVQSPRSYQQVRQFEQYLRGVQNLKILWIGGSEVEGAIIGISVEEPVALVQTLNEIPVVEQVSAADRDIVVRLKSSPVN